MLFLLNLVTTVVLVTKKRRFYLNLVFNLVKRTFLMCFFYRGNEFGPPSPGRHPYRAWGTFFLCTYFIYCQPSMLLLNILLSAQYVVITLLVT